MLSGAEFDALGRERFVSVVAAGLDWVQVRERERDGRALLALVDAVLHAARAGAEQAGAEVAVLVNRRVDVALCAGADGVHLGFDGMSSTQARSLLGETALISVACHSSQEVLATEHASAVHLAPIFAPLSKSVSREPLGLDGLVHAARAPIGVLAQGGITAQNAAACAAAGASGAAVTGAILGADDPVEATAALREALDSQAALS